MNQTNVAMNECVWLQTHRGQGEAARARCRAGPGWAVVFVYVPVASATEGPASTSSLSLRGDFGQMDRRSVATHADLIRNMAVNSVQQKVVF